MPQTYYLGSCSRFVTLTAWLFIVAAACLCGLGLLPVDAPAQAAAPRWVHAFLSQPARSALLGAVMLLAVAVLASAVGLLLRQEWARRGFVGLLALFVVADLAHVALESWALRASSPLPEAVVVEQALAAAGPLVVTIALLWLMHRLRSPLVRQEFSA